MHREWARAPLSALLLTAIATLTVPGCTLLLVRDLGIEGAIERGSVTGRLVRTDADDEPAPFAQVALPGSRRSVRTDSEGRFTMRGLLPGNWALRLVDDADGDGWAERAGLRAFRVALEPHANSPADLVVGSAETEITGLILGDVPLEATGVIDGHVTLQGNGFPTTAVGRVAVIRESAGDGDSLTVALGAEALTHVDDDGRFYFAGLRGGPAKVVALAYDIDDATGELGDLLGMSEPVVVTISSDTELDAPLDIGTVDIDSDLASPLDDRRTVVIALSGQVGASAYFMFAPPGRAFPVCEDSPADYANSQFDYIQQSDLLGVGDAFPNVDVPVGLVDVQACSGGIGGVLRQQLAEDGIPVWGPIAVGAEEKLCETLLQLPETSCTEDADCRESSDDLERCLPTGEREGLLGTQAFACFTPIQGDCDGDLVPGLPQLTPETAYVWEACGLPGIVDGVRITSRCGGLRGEQVGGATCTVRTGEWAGDYDCDDDGDGQADVDEPLCYGEDLGTDLDGDGLCSGLDPFPLCFDNNPVDCDADRNDAAAPRGEVPMLDGGFMDTDAGEMRFDGGSDIPLFDAGSVDLDGGTGTTLQEQHLQIDDTWASGGVASLLGAGLLGQVIPARITTRNDQAYVFATGDDAGPGVMIWSVDAPSGVVEGGAIWGGDGFGAQAYGDGFDLLVDDGQDPPKAVLAMTTSQDVVGAMPMTPPDSWGWMQVETTEMDHTLISTSFQNPDPIVGPQYGFEADDGGVRPRVPEVGETLATGVSQAPNGELWLTGATVYNGLSSVFAYSPGFVNPSEGFHLVGAGPNGTLPTTRWGIPADLDGDELADAVFVPGMNDLGQVFIASFDLFGGGEYAPLYISQTLADSPDPVLDGFTDGVFRLDEAGNPELVLVGRAGSNTVFIERVAINGPTMALSLAERSPLPSTTFADSFEPRVAAIDDRHVVVVVMGGTTIPGAFTLEGSSVLVAGNGGVVLQTQVPGDLGEPDPVPFVDVHPAPDRPGSFLLVRYSPTFDAHTLIRADTVLGPAPGGEDTADGGATDPGMDGGGGLFDGG